MPHEIEPPNKTVPNWHGINKQPILLENDTLYYVTLRAEYEVGFNADGSPILMADDVLPGIFISGNQYGITDAYHAGTLVESWVFGHFNKPSIKRFYTTVHNLRTGELITDWDNYVCDCTFCKRARGETGS